MAEEEDSKAEGSKEEDSREEALVEVEAIHRNSITWIMSKNPAMQAPSQAQHLVIQLLKIGIAMPTRIITMVTSNQGGYNYPYWQSTDPDREVFANRCYHSLATPHWNRKVQGSFKQHTQKSLRDITKSPQRKVCQQGEHKPNSLLIIIHNNRASIAGWACLQLYKSMFNLNKIHFREWPILLLLYY